MKLRRRLGLGGRGRGPRGREPASRRPHRALRKAPHTLAVAGRSALTDIVGIAREIVSWPVRILLGAAGLAARLVLTAWRSIALPLAALVLRALRGAVDFGEREVTPVRGLTVVALAATIGLGASQFSDYHAVEVGAPAYQGVEGVAPAPQVDRSSPRSAHGVAVFAIAIAALFVTVFASARNWRLARLLIFLGGAAVLVSLLVDLHQGLEVGSAGQDYEGAKAVLLSGFWAQLTCGVTLMVVGPLLAAHLRAERDARRAREPVGVSTAGVVSTLVSTRGSGMQEPAT